METSSSSHCRRNSKPMSNKNLATDEDENNNFDDSASSMAAGGTFLGVPANSISEMNGSLSDLNDLVRREKVTTATSTTATGSQRRFHRNSFTSKHMDTLDMEKGEGNLIANFKTSCHDSDRSFLSAHSLSNHTRSAHTRSNHKRLGYDDDGLAVQSSEGSSHSEHTTHGMSQLQKALVNAADQAFGIYATEAWIYVEDTSLLVNVGNGLQVHRAPQLPPGPYNPTEAKEATDALDQLINTSRMDYYAPTSQSPGVGLPGVLWSEVGTMNHLTAEDNVVIWRQVDALAQDPDQPHDERLQLFSKAGFQLAAGIHFNIRGYKGMVIYYANPYADKQKLLDIRNERFMCSQADLIGAIFAVAQPTQDIIMMKKQIRSNNWRKLKLRIIATIRFGGSLLLSSKTGKLSGSSSRPSLEGKRSASDIVLEKAARCWKRFKDEVHDKRELVRHEYKIWSHKCKGGNVKPAPPMSFQQVLWTFAGVAIAHCVVSRLHELIKDESKGQYTLVLAPIGSITALQYSLTAAPSGQPRSILVGQTIAISIGLLLTYLPSELDDWVRLTMAPALAIPTLAFLGIPHPPAGATAIVFASGELDWIDLCIFVAALCFSILLAVAINNLSDLRQYPTNWILINSTKDYVVQKINTATYQKEKSRIDSDNDDNYLDNEEASVSSAAFLTKFWGGRRKSGNAAAASNSNSATTLPVKKQDRIAASNFVVDRKSITGIRLKSPAIEGDVIDLVGDDQC